MKKFLALTIVAATAAFLPHPAFAEDDAAKGKQLGREVWEASGGPNWAKVKTIDFTFAVEKNGQQVAQAEHHWDVAAQTDEVKWKGKDITVDLANPASTEEAKAAYARWVNDSYWLLAPLKVLDRGVTLEAEGTKEIKGAKCDVLRLSFAQVGLTPSDQYRLYVEPATKLVTYWDYIPKDGKGMSGTWEDYQKSGGLTLATDHQMDGGLRIRFLNLKVSEK